jgi:hypothetical protein
MTPTILNLTIFQGVAFDPGVLTYRDSAGNAVNVTGWTAQASARVTPCGPVVLELSPTVSNGAAGEFTIAQNAATTANLANLRGGWDLVVTAPNGERYGPVYAGRIGVSPLHSQPV